MHVFDLLRFAFLNLSGWTTKEVAIYDVSTVFLFEVSSWSIDLSLYINKLSSCYDLIFPTATNIPNSPDRNHPLQDTFQSFRNRKVFSIETPLLEVFFTAENRNIRVRIIHRYALSLTFLRTVPTHVRSNVFLYNLDS
jgi:hypothetical protein